MNEIQQVVDELRFILQREVIEQTDELAKLVAEYSQHCHEANARLRRCDDCVKQGLRSEALHLAEAKPNLLDAIAILDFPERDELLDIVSMYFMTPPEPLLLDVATALNAAYAEQEPLYKLFDLHRLLALGRGPLAQRLTVLRSLADLDSSSPHWDIDIREMERARFRELDTESLSAAKSGNVNVLKSLVGEIQAGGWREAIPNSLARDLNSRANQTVRGNARDRIVELNEELHAAFSALDATTARPLRDAWKQMRQLIKVDDDDPLVEQVAPILDWLDDEDRKDASQKAFSKVVTDVEAALDNEDVTAADLSRLKLAADQLQRRLPEMLETRFRSRLNTLDLIERRRKRLFVGAGVGVAAIVAGMFGMIVYLSMEGEKTRRLVAAVSSFIDEGNLSEAQKLIDQRAAQSTSEAWLGIKKKLADAEQTERDRVLKWKTEIATAREATDTILIEAALKQARELSKTAEEKIEVGQLQSTWQKRVNEATTERERAFREAIALATAALKTLDTALTSSESFDPERIKPLLDGADVQLARLLPLRDSVAKELSSQATLLESRLNASHQTVADLGQKAELLDKITDAVLLLPGSAETLAKTGRYEEMLHQFAAGHPNDPRAATMKAAAESSPLVATLPRQKLVERWKHFRVVDKADVETRLKEIRSFFTAYPQSPDRELLSQYETWLVSVLRRFEEDGDPDEGIQRRMVALFNGRFIKDGEILQDIKGNTYYLTKPLTISLGGQSGVTYTINFQGDTKVETLAGDQLLTQKSGTPPHQKLAADVRSTIRNVAPDGWRDYFRDLADKVQKADKVDPFLRYLFLLKTVEFAGRGDSLLEQELAPLLAKINDDEIDRSVPWMNPKSESANAARVRAGEILKSLPPVEPFFKAVTERQQQFEHDLFALRFSVGWLEKTSRGEWVCRTKWKPDSEHELYVVSRPDENGSRKWSRLGHVKDRSFAIDSSVAQSVGEVSVVFASASLTDVKTAFVSQR